MATTNPRTFTVESRRGTRTVTSTLTDAECLEALARVPNDTFAADLARQGRDRGLSPRQWAWAFVIVEEYRQQHAAREAEAREAFNRAEPIVTGEFQIEALHELFAKAREHLKYPKIRMIVGNDRYRLYVAGERARNPGYINVETDDKARVGQISLEGFFIPQRGIDMAQYPGLIDHLRRLAADPARIAAEYGRELGSCCFCGLDLDDERSTAMGYGPICAKHYGLPWGEADKEMRCERIKREKVAEAVLGVK